MADPVKKFSFGFTKTTKKTNFASKPRIEAKADKQLIDCLEGKLIKVKGGEKCVEEKPLIIPLQPSSRKSLVKSENKEVLRDQNSYFGENVVVKQEKVDTEELLQSPPIETPALPLKTEPQDSVDPTLEEIAAREILQEAENLQKKDDYSNLTVPAAPETDELSAEPTAEDYEAIPVSAFGIAMLKGMGWQEEAGIGKKPQKIATVEATGPKRLSSAAEQKLRAANIAPKLESLKEEEELKLTKGAFVKVLSGSSKGEYGEVEGFTDECDRVLVKLAIRGLTISFSEAGVQVVTKSEYSKNSRVLNSSKYEEVKNKVSQSLEDTSRQSSPKRSRKSVDISPERGRYRSQSPRGRRERSPNRRKRSPDRRKERTPSDRSSHLDRKYQETREKSPSSSPDRKRKKSASKHSRRESPRKRSSSSLSPVRDSKRKNYEESTKRSRNDKEKSRHSREDSYSRKRPNSRSVSPQESRKRVEKARKESSSDSESQRKVKKSSKKKHKRRSSSDSNSSCPKKSSSHKKKKKSHKKKKSKHRESSSSPERRKK